MRFSKKFCALAILAVSINASADAENVDQKNTTIPSNCSAQQQADNCTACFRAKNNVKEGYRVGGFYNVWDAGSNPDEVYLNENPSPIRFNTPYPEVVRQFGSFVGMWQGTSYTDPRYGPYIPVASGQEVTILSIDPSYKVGLLKLTPEIITAGRDSHIFELQYLTKYWEVGRKESSIVKSCIYYYPKL